MKKLLISAAVVAVLAGGAAVVLPPLLNGKVEDAVDAEIARLAAEDGVAITYAEREISGFPLSGEIALRDVTVEFAGEGARWRSEHVLIEVVSTSEARISADDRSIFILDAAGPEGGPLVVEMMAPDLEILVRGGAGGGEVDIAAPRVTLAHEGVGALKSADLALEGLSIALAGGLERVMGNAGASALTGGYSIDPDGVSGSSTEITATEVSADFSADRIFFADFAGAVEQGGVLDVSLQAASTQTAATTAATPRQPGYGLDIASGASRFVLGIEGGRAGYSGQSAAQSGSLSFDRFSGLPSGGFSLDASDFALEMPVRPSEEGQPYALALSLDALALDDAIWGALDPGEVLDRAPVSARIDIDGLARLLTPLGGLNAGGPPIELETLEIAPIRLSGLGAAVELTAKLDIIPGAPMPEGEGRLVIDGLRKLTDDLTAAGVIDAGQGQLANILALTYGRIGETPDQIISDLVMRDGALTANGRPVGAP